MRETKLFKLLEGFSKKERSDFHAFLISPYHNAQSDLVVFYELLVPALKDKRIPALEKDVIAGAFPELVEDATFVRNLKHALLKAARQFIVLQQFEADTRQQALYLVRDARTRNGGSDFAKEWGKQEKEWSDDVLGQDDPDSLYFWFLLGMEQTYMRAKANRRSADSFLVETLERLDDFYLLQKLRMTCAYLSQRGLLLTEAPLPGPDLEAFWTADEAPKATVTGLYRCVYQMLSRPEDPGPYALLIHLLLHSGASLQPQTFTELFGHASNRCIVRINRGQAGAKLELIELFKQVQAFPEVVELLMENPFLGKSLVTAGASIGDFAFAQSIADTIADEHFPGAKAFNQGVICFFQGKLAEAAKCHLQVMDEAKDRFYFLDALVQILLIDYQMQDERLESMYDRFRMHLIRNEEIAAPHRQKFRFFQAFFLQLMKVDVQDVKGLQAFRERITEDTELRMFLWVFDWLDQMRDKKK